MKQILMVFLCMVSMSFANAGTLLDCNISSGPDQQVTVKKDKSGALTLVELSESGAMSSRSLSQTEWASGKLNLRTGDYGGKAILQKVKGGWFYTLAAPGVGIQSYADCE